MRDLAAQELLVALEGSDHGVGVASAERHHIDRCKLEVRRHPHFRQSNDVTLEVGVMHIAVRQDLRERVTHGLADPQLTLRAAGGGGLSLMLARHFHFSMASRFETRSKGCAPRPRGWVTVFDPSSRAAAVWAASR